MKKTNLFFFALFIAANVFVGCDSSLYDDVSVSNQNTTDSGTSMACPQVAAIAALILSINPNLKAIEVNDIIEQTARKVGGYSYTTTSGRPNGTWNNYMGYGLVDATAAVKAAQATLSK